MTADAAAPIDVNVININTGSVMSMVARVDHPDRFLGPFRPLGVVLVVLGLIFCWPVGVATLAFLIWSGRMTCGHHEGWSRGCGQGWGGERWQERMMARRARWEQRWAEHRGRHVGARPSSGNRAFDEYRIQTLRRLEDEEKEFREFLDRLRLAKDKAEFDEFLANRRPPAPPANPEPAA